MQQLKLPFIALSQTSTVALRDRKHYCESPQSLVREARTKGTPTRRKRSTLGYGKRVVLLLVDRLLLLTGALQYEPAMLIANLVSFRDGFRVSSLPMCAWRSSSVISRIPNIRSRTPRVASRRELYPVPYRPALAPLPCPCVATGIADPKRQPGSGPPLAAHPFRHGRRQAMSTAWRAADH